MLKDVNISITDGQISAESGGTGIHLKIGASSVISEELILIRGTYDAKRIKKLLGLSPLADACMDSVENGSSITYCMPVKPSTVGTIGAVSKVGTGTGTVAVTGSPNNAYDIRLSITEDGGFNQAAFTYSLNGSVTVSEEITMPLTGSFVLADTGVTVAFTEGTSQATSFIEGDTFNIVTTAPALTNSDILSAIDKIKNLKPELEFVHIVGETSAATWAAVSTAQKTLLETDKIAMMFMLEAYLPLENETAEQYADSLISARKTVSNYDLQVVTARCNYLRMDGSTKNINMAGIVSGWYANSPVQRSIGRTNQFSLSTDKALKLMPDGIEEQLQYLDEAGFLTFRTYVGLDGIYVTNARMICPEGSDYKYAEHTRVKNKIIRKLRTEALNQMHAEIDIADVDGSLQVIAKFLEAPLDQMVADKEVSAARVIIPEGQDVLTTEAVALKVRFTPIGYAREFEIDLGMEKLV